MNSHCFFRKVEVEGETDKREREEGVRKGREKRNDTESVFSNHRKVKPSQSSAVPGSAFCNGSDGGQCVCVCVCVCVGGGVFV